MLQTKLVPFTFVRKRIVYFSKRVPADLIHYYRYIPHILLHPTPSVHPSLLVAG